MDQKTACVESIRGLVADDSYGSDNWLKRNLSSADNEHRSQAQELMPATFQGGAMAYDVSIAGTPQRAKVRNPWGVVGLTVGSEIASCALIN